MEPFFPRGTPEHDDDDGQQHAADARARLIRARSSSGAGPRDGSPSLSSTMFDTRRRLFLSPRSLAVGAVAASLLVYACAVLMVPSSVRWFFWRRAGREKRKNEREKQFFFSVAIVSSPSTFNLLSSRFNTHSRPPRASPSALPGSTLPAAAGARGAAQTFLITCPLWEARASDKAEKKATPTPLRPRPRSRPPTPCSLSLCRRRAPLAHPLRRQRRPRESTLSSPPTARPT